MDPEGLIKKKKKKNLKHIGIKKNLAVVLFREHLSYLSISSNCKPLNALVAYFSYMLN